MNIKRSQLVTKGYLPIVLIAMGLIATPLIIYAIVMLLLRRFSKVNKVEGDHKWQRDWWY